MMDAKMARTDWKKNEEEGNNTGRVHNNSLKCAKHYRTGLICARLNSVLLLVNGSEKNAVLKIIHDDETV
jgi:hypothetical protein